MSNKKLIITTLVSIACFFIILFGSDIQKNPSLRQVKNDTKSVKAVEKKSMDNSSNEASDNSDSQKDVAKNSNSGYKDGTYSGVGAGFKGDISVSVNIESGKISNIEVTGSQDDAEYFDKAKSLISDIISSQNPDVSVVSGATYSSNGIISAVKDALNKGGN